MKTIKTTSVSALFAGVLILSMSCSTYANTGGDPGEMRDNPGSYSSDAGQTVKHHRSYGTKIGQKALRGFGNVATAIVELPKNVINTTNAPGSNIMWGLAGGLAKGLVNIAGRLATGCVDILTFPIPTKSIQRPEYPWQLFNQDTTYGYVFRYDDD